jgi:hypothetical protein
MRTIRERLESKISGYKGVGFTHNSIDNAIEDSIFENFDEATMTYNRVNGEMTLVSSRKDEIKLEKLSLLYLLEMAYSHYTDKSVSSSDDINSLDMKGIATQVFDRIKELKKELNKSSRVLLFRVIQ